MTFSTLDGCLANEQIMTALDDFSDGYMVFDEDLSFKYLNAAAERAFGHQREEVLGKPFSQAFPTARGSVFEDAFARCMGGGECLDFQTFFGIGAAAQWYDVLVSPGEMGISMRIRALEDRGETAEKERVVREFSHRIKNSLSVISSLASVESGSIKDEVARESLDRLQGRIHATSLLYDKLSRSEGSGSIDAAEYIAELASLIEASFSDGSGRVSMEFALSRLELDSKRASALGLAANEAITNSFKYAFAEGGRGRIKVELALSRGRVLFAVEDDGPGFPCGFDPLRDGDIGYALLAEKARELGGKLTAGPGSGGQGPPPAGRRRRACARSCTAGSS
jgi:PAS domain S-box-containing protein